MSPLRYKVRDANRKLIAKMLDPMDAVVLSVRHHGSIIQFNDRIVWKADRDWNARRGYGGAVLQMREVQMKHYEEYRAKYPLTDEVTS